MFYSAAGVPFLRANLADAFERALLQAFIIAKDTLFPDALCGDAPPSAFVTAAEESQCTFVPVAGVSVSSRP
jgi:hypothetical protein